MNYFTRTKKERWEELQSLLDRLQRSPSQLSEQQLRQLTTLYLSVTQDLAYAQLHYKNTDTELFLNNLVGEAYKLIYKSPPVETRRVYEFLRYEFPFLVRKNMAYVLISFFIFSASGFAAYVSCRVSPKTQEAFFPKRFLKKISSGTKKAKKDNEHGISFPDALKPVVSSAIMTNNMQVAFIAFSTGILLCTGTVLILIQNGLLIGAVAYAFRSQEDALYFWSMILPHGILELFAIFVSGAAGLLIGYSLIAPGDYTRKEALMRAGKDAIKLVAGILPILAAAGIIEGFITPASAPPEAKLLFALLTALLLFAYIALPQKRSTPFPAPPSKSSYASLQ